MYGQPVPDQIHIVVRKHVVTREAIICTASEGSEEPAVFRDAAHAEIRCAELRGKWLNNANFANVPDNCPYHVISTPVL